jgi:translation initiation factor IF-2
MPKKIFELAKEYDMRPLDLVEWLKGKDISVRNHMSSLNDDEIEQVKLLFIAENEQKVTTGKKKKAKKKVTKKKTAKKATEKTAKKKKTSSTIKKTSSKKGEIVEEEPILEEKKKTIKKKTVIRRKTKEDPEQIQSESVPETEIFTEEIENKEVITESVTVTSEATIDVEDIPEVKTDENGTSGLRIVSRSKVKTEPVEEKPKEKDENKTTTRKFTPTYIPSKDPNNITSSADGTASADDENKSKSESKKRLGGLATMMSTKKTSMSKSQLLTKDRADTEMKSYATLNILGRPIYSERKRKKSFSGLGSQTEITEIKDSKRVVNIHKVVTADNLAQKLSQKFTNLVDKCLEINLLIKPSDAIGFKLSEKIAALYGYRVEDKAFDESTIIGGAKNEKIASKNLTERNPIITIMGHVDHGKTTLLDHIRNEKVAEGEAGGITQHIAAYSVKVKKQNLTFLDTPGHAAFTSMRQRGASVTDIVVLVVAADDGVMPQTKESVNFCLQAEVPIIVAVNKMDKEGANPERVKTELSELGLTSEDWGGDVQFCNISALKGDGIDGLLESIALQAELMELKADKKAQVEGVVIESQIQAGRGPIATVLIQEGTLSKGHFLVVGESYGRARSLSDSYGKQLKEAGPSTPIQVLGLDNAPNPGDILNVVKNEREAKKVVSNRIADRKELETAPEKKKMSLEDFFGSAPVAEGDEKKVLKLMIRADVNGSFEAIKQSVESLSNSEVEVKLVGGGVGAINDSDVQFADSASAFIIGFNMRPISTARRIAERIGLEIKTYSIIYELINDIKLAMEGLLDPDVIEEFIGRSEVREAFSITKVGVIAGSYVTDGKIEVGCSIRLLRSGKIIFDGKMSSLKRFKDEVKEVKSGFECGIGLENFNDVKVGDIFEAYKLIEKKRTLEDVEKKSMNEEPLAHL